VEKPIAGVEANCFVRSNPELAGQLAADYIGHRFPGGGKAAVLLGERSDAQNTMQKAFRDYLKEEHEKVQMAGSETATDAAAQRQAAEKLLAGSPQAIFATSDSAALAAAEAVQARGSKCVVVGYGGLPATLEAVKSGKSPLQMTNGPFPQRVARFATRQVVNMLKDDETNQRAEVPVFPVTKDNYGTYPDWTGQVPRDLPIPWDSDLTIEMRRE
jgi:ABC-type sugar transport system substrate-binding protein